MEKERAANSPWNIAADFDLDMSLSVNGIVSMLKLYEYDHHTGMAVREIAQMIYDYTSGYPFLVSRICKLVDEVISEEEESVQQKRKRLLCGMQPGWCGF